MSDSLQPHGLQHTRLPCPSPTSRDCANSCPLTQWCHPTSSSTVISFFSCLQSFPASRSLPVSQFFASGGQSIGVSASASVLPMNIQDWFPLRLTYLISLLSKGLSRVFNTTVQSINSLALSFVYDPWSIWSLRSWHLVPSLHGKQMGKQWKQWQTLFSWAPKSLQMGTAAMKLKDTSSLEEKLWPT